MTGKYRYQSIWVNGEAKKAIDGFPLPKGQNYSERVKAIVNLANRYVEEKGIDVLFSQNNTPNGDISNEEQEEQE